ncbi:hypothetical protein LCM4577_00410 [Mesorhizobium sp. LCM 4577]|uniref:Uncharacterized protein n=1 Tax=Mesorhizobium plurifarium TaxID=69974 RepID=A0A090GDZ1_MESPL|nr:hypothetical protein [Mesorhizobium sp. LCM 4577]OHV70682.1 hypothetical protein LCM4577_00410 [Mesorhizobium sp. LCM 4577]CDX63033.1 conserved exported hypothetical protein [Mesorhizobium plurifarium]
MTAFLRNILLAAVAVSALTGSALADETVKSCAQKNLNDLWSGHCCGAGDASCIGGHGRGGDHDNGGRGSPNGGSTKGAGKP